MSRSSTGGSIAKRFALLLRYLVPAASIDHAFVCGPHGMSESVEAALLAAGLTPNRSMSSVSFRPKAVVRAPVRQHH